MAGLQKSQREGEREQKKKKILNVGDIQCMWLELYFLFPGMCLNTSSRQQRDYSELVHWNVLRMEADPVQTSEKWGCYNVEYLINERKTEKIH